MSSLRLSSTFPYFCIFFVWFSCKKEVVETSQTLASVDGRLITVREYLERAELTVRPNYCQGKGLADKQIVLNSLIGEKLLALEGEKDSVLTNNPSFRAYLQGITEQAMRNRLLEQEVEQKIEIDNAEIAAAMKKTSKIYKVAYLFSKSENEANTWKQKAVQADGFERVAKAVCGEEPPPVKEVTWGEYEETLENAIYDDSVEVGSIVGPIKTSVGYYLLQILDIRTQHTLGHASADALFRKVENKLKTKKWRLLAANYVADIMQDKRIQLDPVGFRVLADIYKPLYSKADAVERIDPEGDSQDQIKALKRSIRENLGLTLLTINGEPLSVGEFAELLRVRPLMFRAKNIRAEEFPAYFKLAIKDVIRDKYLTDVAYASNLDRDSHVMAVEQQWRDHLLAIGKRNQMMKEYGLEESASKNPDVVTEFLQPYLLNFAEKYSVDKDVPALEKITLTSIPWMAIQSGAPYPQRVPPFPIVTKVAHPEYLSSAAVIKTDKHGRDIYTNPID